MGICVSIHAAGNRGAAGNGTCFFYDGHCHPFLRLRDGTHLLAARTCDPRPLAQVRQIILAAPVGAVNLGPGRQIVSRRQPGRRQPNPGGQAGAQAPDPTPVSSQNRGSRAGSTNPQSPCRLFRLLRGVARLRNCAQTLPLCAALGRTAHPHRATSGHPPSSIRCLNIRAADRPLHRYGAARDTSPLDNRAPTRRSVRSPLGCQCERGGGLAQVSDFISRNNRITRDAGDSIRSPVGKWRVGRVAIQVWGKARGWP